MKKTYIIALVAIAVGILFLINTSADVSNYSTFKEAQRDGNRVKVVGTLSKEKPMDYHPEVDPNLFKFYMLDNDGMEKQVHYLGAKPQDFEMSEQLVVTGRMENQIFISDEILMKCPSKYKGEEELINAQNNG